MKKEMLINVLQPEECRIAIVEDGVLEELYVERTSHESYTGNIYLGRVVNLEPAIQAAFVDFSVGRNGFLHASDVEPQYYRRLLGEGAELPARDRGREPRKDRDEPRAAPAPRAEDRAATPPPPAQGEARPRERDRGRDRDRDRERPKEKEREWGIDWDSEIGGGRERPDLSEKPRRGERRFGEGLLGDWEEPAPPPAREEPPRPARAAEPPREPRAPRGEVAPPAPAPREELPPRAERERAREPWGFGEEEPRGRIDRPSGFDPENYLPPSRTQRARRPRDEAEEPARARPFEPDEPEAVVPPAPEAEIEPAAPPAERRRGGGRGRGRSARPAPEPVPETELIPAPEPVTELFESEPEPDEDRPEAEPGRRRGRDAIRARGGDRAPGRPRERERDRAPEPPPAERPARPAPPERSFGGGLIEEFDRPEAVESERPAARGRGRDRAAEAEPARARDRAPEPEPGRERERVPGRQKPHDRAGEPGYVPRRERDRAPEPPPARAEAPAPFDWSEPSAEERADRAPSPLDRLLEDEGATQLLGPEEPERGDEEEGDLEGPRRRRRRRRRRRGDRADEAPEGEAAEADELEADFGAVEEEFRAARGRPARFERAVEALREHEPDEDLLDEADEPDEVLLDTTRARGVDDEIEPELEEEIRREIEEIQELEREMGLRGPAEARPRRGDDREAGAPAGAERARGERPRGFGKPPIQEIFRRGDQVLVQVIKESIGTKGPTLSTYISIPGRYLVLMPGLNRVGVSRKIADESQRRRLREIMHALDPPKGLGFIVRTAGLDRTKRELAKDLAYLLRLWKVILRRIKKAKAPSPIYQESDMIIRTIRDIFNPEIDTIWIDEPQAFERAQEFLRVVMPKYVHKLKFYDERVPLFHKYGLEEEIARIQRRRVDLPGGGSIVIDQTEALVAIDVNSGNFRVEDDAERTAYEMNLRAAREIARQLRLRDLGGVIANDFIDMRDEKHRRGVERALREAVRRDRARTKILRMSQFGIIEMTRQRIRPSLKRSVYEDCPHCNGSGVVKTAESMSIDVMRLLALAAHRSEIRRVNVVVAAPVATYLANRKRKEITRIEEEADLVIHVRHEDGVPAEHLQIDCFDAGNNEIRLLPSPPPPHPRRGR